MIEPRLTSCTECTQISVLLGEINTRITEIAKLLYSNITLLANNVIPRETMNDLLNYKRILTYKSYNTDYAPDYTIAMIAGKVKILKYR